MPLIAMLVANDAAFLSVRGANRNSFGLGIGRSGSGQHLHVVSPRFFSLEKGK